VSESGSISGKTFNAFNCKTLHATFLEWYTFAKHSNYPLTLSNVLLRIYSALFIMLSFCR